MSTRSMIGKLEDGKIKAIYCHFDGYPEGVGKKLKELYMDKSKIDDLLALGDISFLGDNTISSHRLWELYEGDVFGVARGKYDDIFKNCSLAFKDRWENDDTDYTAMEFSTKKDYMKHGFSRDAEYIYLFENGEWKVSTGHSFKAVSPEYLAKHNV